mmetsp:Transcript_67028/g.143385  ORF Transcript_67028/g.143385 Transcript_67028/m.143385 type:complete len:452 (-) Transcript_67028:138-1493(-)
MALFIQKKASLYAPYRDRDSAPSVIIAETYQNPEGEDDALKAYGLNIGSEDGYTWNPETFQDGKQTVMPWDVDVERQLKWEDHTFKRCMTYEEWNNEGFILEIRQGIAYCTMNEAFNNNAWSSGISTGYTDISRILRDRHDVRVAVLAGNGRMFSSGGDPKAFQAEQRAAGAIGGDGGGDGGHQFSEEQIAKYRAYIEARQDAEEKGFYMENPKGHEICGIYQHWDRLVTQQFDDNVRGGIIGAYMFYAWATIPQFSICCKHGSSMGGALGILAASDYVVAVKTAFAVLSEVRLGVIPAVVSTHVIRALGPSNALRVFATAENLNAKNALELGLVQRIVQHEREYPAVVKEICEKIQAVSPEAVRFTKKSIFNTINRPMSGQMMEYLAQESARVRKARECEEGMACAEAMKPMPWEEKNIDFKEDSYKAEIWWLKKEEDKKEETEKEGDGE